MSLAILAAPLLAGIVYSTGGYYRVYAILFGVISLDIVLRLAMIERKLPRHIVLRQNEHGTTRDEGDELRQRAQQVSTKPQAVE